MHLQTRGLTALLLLLTAPALAAQTPTPGIHDGTQGGEWRYWGGDAGATRYSPLAQIDASNAANLEIAWRWDARNFGPQPETYYRSTPIYANGRLFSPAGSRRSVVAIDPATGETLWTWRPDEDVRWAAAPRRFSARGVAYWTDGVEERIYVVTAGYFLVALDARTGREVASFGSGGRVDLQVGLGYDVDPVTGIDERHGRIGSSSPPLIVGDMVVVGGSHVPGLFPHQRENIPGHVRAYDVHTGEQRWIFHVVPRPGEFGHETWEDDSWEYTGNIGAWPPFSADPDLGIVYIPLSAATNDFYGGQRPGDNLFATSLVAVRADTGERVWHQQLIRHDLWDWDLPTAPALADVDVDGRRVPVVVQATKQAWAYVFDRRTGESVWPMEERAVAASDVPGERASPTQPFPTRPAPYDRQGVTIDDLIDFTPELRAEAIEMVSAYRLGPIFTPPSLLHAPDGTTGTLIAPGATGGSDARSGVAFDPETGVFYVASLGGHQLISLEHNPERSSMDYVSLGAPMIPGPRGLPLLKPPYGRITAIDMKSGDHLWMVPNGDTPPAVRDHPALQGLDIPPTGRPTHANLLLTRSLLFAGEGRGQEPVMRALDKRTGATLAEIRLPAPTNASPMTYLHEGVQYVVVAVANASTVELVALRLRTD